MPGTIRLCTLRRTALLLLTVVLLPVASLAQTTRLTFLHTNDNYEIVPTSGWGGFAQLMTVLKEQRTASANALTTFGGDLLSPSIMSGLHGGAQMIELMNAVGTDLAVLGVRHDVFVSERHDIVEHARVEEALALLSSRGLVYTGEHNGHLGPQLGSRSENEFQRG